jgi:hypothetical protein
MKANIDWLLGFLLLSFICVFLFYSWIDARVTSTYLLQEQKDQRREIEVLQSLLLEIGKQANRFEIEQIVLKRLGKDRVKKERQDELSLDGGVVLRFKGDSLVEVKSISE